MHILINITIILGMVLGAIMLLATVYVFAKHRSFGLGGSILTTFGTLLVGLAIWQSTEISIGADGNISAKLQARTLLSNASTNHQIATLQRQADEIKEDLSKLRAEVPSLELSPEETVKRQESDADFQANSKYTVLVFHRSSAKSKALRIEEQLLAKGFSSSSTATDFTELARTHPAGTIYVTHSESGSTVLEEIKTLLESFNFEGKIIVQDSTTDIVGDIQVLVF